MSESRYSSFPHLSFILSSCMSESKKYIKKQCEFCGRFFTTDPRVSARQRSCASGGCKARRKAQSQKEWVRKNPDYFKGRYDEVLVWRKTHPDYQRAWRAKRREIQDEKPMVTPCRTIRLRVPVSFFKDEIQDEITLVRRCGCGTYG